MLRRVKGRLLESQEREGDLLKKERRQVTGELGEGGGSTQEGANLLRGGWGAELSTTERDYWGSWIVGVGDLGRRCWECRERGVRDFLMQSVRCDHFIYQA